MNIIWLKDVCLKNIDKVGGKNASLGEMMNNLTKLGIKIPNGFATTVDAFKEYMEFNHLDEAIPKMIDEIIIDDIEDLNRKALGIRTMISNGIFPPKLKSEIIKAYANLSGMYKDAKGNPQEYTDVAVRSSSTAEDMPDASFAGQQDTFLNVRGDEQLITAIKNCFASLYTARAISYRLSFGYTDVHMSVTIQKMVRSDLGSSGVAFSLDTESGFKDIVVINGTFGLGELVVQGTITPDEFIVYKPTQTIIDVKLGNKTHKMIYGNSTTNKVTTIANPPHLHYKKCLSDKLIKQLSKWVCIIEGHYSKLNGKYTPMDIEWAVHGNGVDGEGELYIVQARPETVHSSKDNNTLCEYKYDISSNDLNKYNLLTTGIATGSIISTGNVHMLFTTDKRHDLLSNPNKFKKGDILVTDMTDPDLEPIMKKASGVITNNGSRTCHAVIVTRELGIPAIVGTGNATHILKNGQRITMSCAEGEIGKVYEGKIPFSIVKTDISKLPKPKVPIMFNIGSPEKVFYTAMLPNSGVGLVREEFIINNFIGVHPLALLNYDKLPMDIKGQVDRKIVGYESPIDFYVKKLTYGIARIASAFYPNNVIVRFSDFKSNEYRNLLGGTIYEPHEENPMIGWRGASRYYSKEFKEAFGLECKAIKNVRDNLKLNNVIVMVPFCRTPYEMTRVLDTMKEFGLERGINGLKVYLMCEVPSNVILAEEFCKYIDGFSIGSNDLTQLTLGLDRDSHLVSHLYDERSEAVKTMISKVIKTAHENNCKIGICGQGPSDYPDFAKFLMDAGIDSISITPDSYVKTANVLK